ncbi:MAG TPA: hypothetical protein VHG72_15235 [Polyangia bacterium]|nr:hypothetical protein [Polyangia bacterium]
MRRVLALGFLAAAVFTTVGCGDNGSFRLSWALSVGGVLESSSTACGKTGVDSIGILGHDTSGDSTQIRALCTPGAATGSVPNGTWTFEVEMLDAEGNLITPTAATDAGTVQSGGPVAEFAVTLMR